MFFSFQHIVIFKCRMNLRNTIKGGFIKTDVSLVEVFKIFS